MQNVVVIDGELSLIIPDSGEFGIFTRIAEGALPAYTGETEVIPKAFEETTLETANKSVYQDIRVLEIPYTETSNLSGGYTVSIG